MMHKQAMVLSTIILLAACERSPEANPATAATPSDPLQATALAAPPNPLPIEVSSNLILKSLPVYNCTAQISVNGDTKLDPEGFEQSNKFNEWAVKNLMQGGYMVVKTEPTRNRGEGGITELLDHQGSKILLYHVKDGYGSAADYTHTSLTQVSYCSHHPSTVNVLDTTLSPNGKQAEIIFAVESKLSDITNVLGGSGFMFYKGQAMPQVPQPVQRKALLRRLDATG